MGSQSLIQRHRLENADWSLRHLRLEELHAWLLCCCHDLVGELHVLLVVTRYVLRVVAHLLLRVAVWHPTLEVLVVLVVHRLIRVQELLVEGLVRIKLALGPLNEIL